VTRPHAVLPEIYEAPVPLTTRRCSTGLNAPGLLLVGATVAAIFLVEIFTAFPNLTAVLNVIAERVAGLFTTMGGVR
jgi:hypothetical protein